MDNKIAIEIPAAVLATALQHVKDARTALAPYLFSSTPEDRQQMAKMGDKSVALVQKTADYGQSSPQFAPAFFNLPELQQDVKAVTDLTPLRNEVEPLYQLVEDTLMLAGSEAYQAALVYYNGVKFAAAQNQPGAAAVYDDLKQRFPGRPKAPKTPAV